MKKIYELKDFGRTQEDLFLHETIFHNANGYIGIRSNYEEGYPDGYRSIRGSYINGFYDITDMKQAEKLCGLVEKKQTMVNIADTQGIELIVNGEKFQMFEGEVLGSRRWLDMELGYTGRQITWCSPKGHQVEITIKRMTSFVMLSLFTIEYAVRALNFDGSLQFISTHIGEVKNYCDPNDPRVSGEETKFITMTDVCEQDGAFYLSAATSRSGLEVCTGTRNLLSKNAAVRMKAFHAGISQYLDTQIDCGETITLTKFTIFSDSIRYQDYIQNAKSELNCAVSQGLDYWYQKQAEYLEHYWSNCELEIDGDEGLSSAVYYNLYQLLQSVGKEKHCNIAAKGLSGEGYEGHYFWDTEMYIQPFFTLTNPQVSKNLISYRYSILDQARAHARMMGHEQGALYAWRTIMGEECSGHYPSGSAQYHINGDVAYSIVSYYLATKDMEFIVNEGAEIMFETARLWIDTGNYHEGRFEIHEVTGPDEYTCLVSNNYFTNASAKHNLEWAARFYRMMKQAGTVETVAGKIGLREREVEAFEEAAEKMYLPYDKELGINPQDDSFLSKPLWDFEKSKGKHPLLLHYTPMYLYRYQVCKQADTVLAHFVYEDAQDLETIRKSFEYYEKVTTHDSSLSTCIFSIVASKLGLKDKAYQYFGDSAKLDLFNTHHNTKDGIHTANMGGNYMAVVYGFAGLRLKEDGIRFSPFLPKAWNSYRFTINFEGSRIQVRIGDRKVVFRVLDGKGVRLWVYQRSYVLDTELAVELE